MQGLRLILVSPCTESLCGEQLCHPHQVIGIHHVVVVRLAKVIRTFFETLAPEVYIIAQVDVNVVPAC
jgi:hypothetical protein